MCVSTCCCCHTHTHTENLEKSVWNNANATHGTSSLAGGRFKRGHYQPEPLQKNETILIRKWCQSQEWVDWLLRLWWRRWYNIKPASRLDSTQKEEEKYNDDGHDDDELLSPAGDIEKQYAGHQVSFIYSVHFNVWYARTPTHTYIGGWINSFVLHSSFFSFPNFVFSSFFFVCFFFLLRAHHAGDRQRISTAE